MADRTIRDLCDRKVYKNQDDEYLLEGIRLQNEKYQKALAFIRKWSDKGEMYEGQMALEASELLEEIGE